MEVTHVNILYLIIKIAVLVTSIVILVLPDWFHVYKGEATESSMKLGLLKMCTVDSCEVYSSSSGKLYNYSGSLKTILALFVIYLIFLVVDIALGCLMLASRALVLVFAIVSHLTCN